MPGNNGQYRFLKDERCVLSSHRPAGPLVSTNGTSAPPVKGEEPPQTDLKHLQALIILLPLYYNPDRNGSRKPVERCALEQTFAEIKQFGVGYKVYEGEGWSPSTRFRGDFDEHIRIEIEASFNDADIAFLKSWKRDLEFRFQQDSIYMSLYGPVQWI
jgi:hypothetical protein